MRNRWLEAGGWPGAVADPGATALECDLLQKSFFSKPYLNRRFPPDNYFI